MVPANRIKLKTIKLYTRYKRYSSVVVGRPGFDSDGQEIFLYSKASRRALRTTQPPIRCVPWTHFPVVKRPEREADHSPPSSAEIKNGGATPTLSRVFTAWCLIN
jgi:hypothetical protein